jgi:glycosyltransferase involved in cell wall biosynthesis
MSQDNVDLVLFLPFIRKAMHPRVNVVQSLSAFSRAPFRITGPLTRWKLERDFLAAARALPPEQTVAYLWSALSPQLYRDLHDSHIIILREKLNCANGPSKEILDDAYGRLGTLPAHNISQKVVEQELENLSITDFVFCPSPFVESTLIELGIPSSKLISTSYGWEPDRFVGTTGAILAADEPIFLFAGSVCVRKGAHLLLQYWAESRIKGRLVLAGDIEPTIRRRCGSLLMQKNVQCVGYVSDVGALYRSADVFVFPSLEEGGPQVTYEAMGCGLPVLVSPMGGGRIVRSSIDGMIIDPYDKDAWITAMREFARSKELRYERGANSRERALEFTWDRVGRQRVKALTARLAANKAAGSGRS